MTASFIRDPALPMQGSTSTEELLRFERLVSGLSAAFINMPADNIADAIGDALRRIVEALAVDRSTLSIVLQDGAWLETYQSWAVEGIAPVPKGILPLALPWALARARAGLPIVFERLEDLPQEASVERAWYGRHGLRSHVGLPVIVAGELIAILGFGTLRNERTWPGELLDRLKVVAEIFGSALARKRAHEDLERALAFERLLVDVSASLVTRHADEHGASIRSALAAIGSFLRVDRAVLWTLSVDGSRMEATHAWLGDAVADPPHSVNEALLPSLFKAMTSGSVIALSAADDVPGGEEERMALQRLQARSLLVVPLIAEGFVVGALSLAALREARTWPLALIPRVRLIGEVFASVLTRQRAALEVHRAQSETAQYRERLAHLVRVHTVGEMSAAIAHEVNQPLVAIENYAYAAARRISPDAAVDSAKLRELLDKIGVQAARAGDVLKRLRSIVKKHESEGTLFDLGALVGDTMNLVEMESRLKDVRVELAIATGLPRVFADEVQVQQVLVNLARNGIEAMETTRSGAKLLRVEASATEERDAITVRVIDQGRGISEADAAHLFEPFYSTKPQGLGIGLAICRSIIEAHGGRLAHAHEPGTGTVFYFTLPIPDANT